MPPEQPNHNPYEFITNPGKSQKPPVALFAFGKFSSRTVLLVGGSVAVVLILLILAVIASSGSGTPSGLAAVAADQTELARVANLATQSSNISQQATNNFAESCALSTASAQQQYVALLGRAGIRLSNAQLASRQNPSTDQTLNAAAASSTYDQVFLTAMQTDLNTYTNDLKSAYATTQVGAIRQLIKSDYQDAQLLQKQLVNAQNNLSQANS